MKNKFTNIDRFVFGLYNRDNPQADRFLLDEALTKYATEDVPLHAVKARFENLESELDKLKGAYRSDILNLNRLSNEFNELYDRLEEQYGGKTNILGMPKKTSIPHIDHSRLEGLLKNVKKAESQVEEEAGIDTYISFLSDFMTELNTVYDTPELGESFSKIRKAKGKISLAEYDMLKKKGYN